MVGFCRQFGMRKETKNAETVVVCNENDALLRQSLTIISRLRTGARGKTSSICEDNHGSTFGGGFRSGPDIQVQAILAGRRRRRPSSPAAALHASWSKLVRFSNTTPIGDRLRLSPAKSIPP